MSIQLLSTDALEKALNLRDLMDEQQGPHAMQLILKSAHEVLAKKWKSQRIIYRSCPIVKVKENYDSLLYPAEGVSRDVRYTRYVSPSTLLRTHATAAIPVLLRSLAADLPSDILLVSPALCYRRDVIDKIHVGEPHQLDLWRINNRPLTEMDLKEMIDLIVSELLPGREYRMVATNHPYTNNGHQIDVRNGDDWVEIGECGIASSIVLRNAGLASNVSGLAMGIGLDRILMLRKGIPDIRLLRSDDRRVANQMLDLEPYRIVSKQPAIPRDLSIAVREDMTGEEMGDIVRNALQEGVTSLEDMIILSQTPYSELPKSAHERMGIGAGQKNVLLRLVIRHPTKTLTADEANRIRDRVYLELHQGTKLELAMR